MNRTLRILRKDIRHLWPEILISLGIAIAFVAVEPWRWPTHQFFNNYRQGSVLMDCVSILLPLSWWLLIARAIHDETLVGDHQFWTTRPYTWYRVFAAKFLFISLFVVLPFWCAKLALLYRAGLSIPANLSAVTLSVVAAVVVIMLPLWALAAVTANLTRMFLTLFAGALYVALAAYIDSLFGYTRSFGPDSFEWIGILITLIIAIVVVFQYALRRTAISRSVLIVLTLAVTVGAIVSEHIWTPHRTYSDVVAGEPAPLSIQPDLARPSQPQASESEAPTSDRTAAVEADGVLLPPHPKPEISGIDIPVLVAGVLANHVVRVDDVSVRYRLPGVNDPVIDTLGVTQPFLPGSHPDFVHINLGSDNYKQFKDQPLSFEMTFAVTEFEATATETVKVARPSFAIPERGICHILTEEESSQAPRVYRRVPFGDCQYPVGAPSYTFVLTHWSDQPCNQPSTSGVDGSEWIGDEASARSLNFDPVVNLEIRPDNEMRRVNKETNEARFLCPGTPVTFTRYRAVRRRLLHVVLPSVLPKDYVREQNGTITYSNTFRGPDF